MERDQAVPGSCCSFVSWEVCVCVFYDNSALSPLKVNSFLGSSCFIREFTEREKNEKKVKKHFRKSLIKNKEDTLKKEGFQVFLVLAGLTISQSVLIRSWKNPVRHSVSDWQIRIYWGPVSIYSIHTLVFLTHDSTWEVVCITLWLVLKTN